jgi:hypothetical protein
MWLTGLTLKAVKPSKEYLILRMDLFVVCVYRIAVLDQHTHALSLSLSPDVNS